MYAHARAPVRIGIAGGGTDLPAWTASRVGRCLSLAIRTYTHAVAITRSDGQVVAAYRNRDVANAATEIANGLVRESALMHGWETGFEVHTLSELSSHGTGLGVSSSIAVSLAACFRNLRAGIKDTALPMALARDAWTVEIDCLRRPIGRQDHCAAAHGGLRLYHFTGAEASLERSFSDEDANWVAQHLALIELKDGHDSRQILSGVKTTDGLEMANLAVNAAIEAIEKRVPQLLGRAIWNGQQSKIRIKDAVPSWIETIIESIEELPGVHGCKVAGAGGGGHLIVVCDPDARELIQRETLLRPIPVLPDMRGVIVNAD